MKHTYLFSLSPLLLTLALPHDRDHDYNHQPPNLQTLSSHFTLTIFSPQNPTLHDLKVEETYGGFGLYKATCESYCPSQVQQQGGCPNGTELAFGGETLYYPYSIVPGGQNTYILSSGLILITVQHSHFIPPDAYVGDWTWYAFPALEHEHEHEWKRNDHYPHKCDSSDPVYDCRYPSGIFTFSAPNTTVGGLAACPSQYDKNVTVVYAVTPDFKGEGCERVFGLATHEYKGEPVWAYY
ncbi:hypothetical protein BCR34DRAFT_604972 [Clohesyomyces aquaticus]|uniref:Ubiquitin 3 binding protein But2 C-terminal domain-domain-containing protein n=1 Tax=Clohesyomyces aquaticus TaxID=1231657 RepID=A0A1Y1Z1E7_9PLEO|nr:hypothetical protein BCR34DRAFT_604972 [Clohesyomyces aquaticus]